MSDPVSQITIDDGTTSVDVTGFATLDMRIDFENLGGSVVLRLRDGSGIKQTHWTKKRVIVSCEGWRPTGLDAIDWSQELTLTAHDYENGTEDYVGFSDGPREGWDVNSHNTSWTLTLDES